LKVKKGSLLCTRKRGKKSWGGKLLNFPEKDKGTERREHPVQGVGVERGLSIRQGRKRAWGSEGVCKTKRQRKDGKVF